MIIQKFMLHSINNCICKAIETPNGIEIYLKYNSRWKGSQKNVGINFMVKLSRLLCNTVIILAFAYCGKLFGIAFWTFHDFYFFLSYLPFFLHTILSSYLIIERKKESASLKTGKNWQKLENCLILFSSRYFVFLPFRSFVDRFIIEWLHLFRQE